MNVQLKDLTHQFFPRISSHKLYKKGVYSCVFTLKYNVSIWDELKKINLKKKHKIE